MRSAHIVLLANLLEGALRGDYKRLIVELPPRHSKSLHVSELFPAWVMGKNPDLRIIVASYASKLSQAFSRRVRNMIASPEYHRLFPDSILASDSRSAIAWDIAGRHGGMIAAGVGSGITGHGADILIIDDPTKDRAEANSLMKRQSTWDWYTSTARTRLHPGGIIIICTTRWHHDDLAGRLLDGQDSEDEHADEWVEVKFPAIATEDDALGRKAGDALWPERYDIRELLSIKTAIGIRDWIALYQQEPSDEEGAIFPIEKWKYYPDSQEFHSQFRNFQLWDTAYKPEEINDYSVCATWTRGPGGICYLRDIRRWRVAFPELKRLAKAQYDKWKPDRIYVEDKGSGTSLIQEFQTTGMPILPYLPDGSKEVRAHAVTPFIESGRMLLPESGDFLADFLEEHTKFPAGKYDDMVDTTSMAGLILARAGVSVPEIVSEEKVSQW